MAKDDKDWNFDRLYSALALMQEVQNDIARAMHKGKMNDVVRDRCVTRLGDASDQISITKLNHD